MAKIHYSSFISIAALILAASVAIWGFGWGASAEFAKITNLLETLVKNTEPIPKMAFQVNTIYEITISSTLKKELGNPADPAIKPTCERLLPEDIKKQIQNIVTENKDKPKADIADLLVSKLNFELIWNISKEKNVPFNKYLKIIGAYARELIEQPF